MLSQDLIQKARAYALAEIEQYGLPNRILFDISEKQALLLGEKLWGDVSIILLWIYLMDIKLGQAFAEKRLSEHIQMWADAAMIFLQQEWVDQTTIDKVVHCILAHHGTISYESLEAEICANADCYRFISPAGFFANLHSLGQRGLSFQDSLDQAEKKMEEKYAILSLEICKNECENHYQKLTEYIALSRKELS